MFTTKNKKKIFIYIISFIFILIYSLFFVPLTANEIWNYGFSYAIVKGEILYNDFNLIIGPFYPLFMSISLLIKNCLFNYLFFNSIIILMALITLYKMYDKKVIISIIILLFFPSLVCPSYNQFIIFLIIFIAYLEKSESGYKDILIGILLSISFFTKQNIGIFLILPSIFFYKKNNNKERIMGFIIPTIIFLLYFIITKSLKNYINLCILGLLEFGNKNNLVIVSCLIAFIIILIISVVCLLKNKSNISLYYYLMGYLVILPIFDYIHLYFVIFIFSLLIIDVYKFDVLDMRVIRVCLYFLILNILIIESQRLSLSTFKYPNNINHLQLRYIPSNELKYYKKVINYLNGEDFLIYSDVNYLYKIALDKKISNYDIVNYGNNGIGSKGKIVDFIKKNKQLYLIPNNLSKCIEDNICQVDKEGYDYIINNLILIDSIGEFYVYENK